MGKTPNKSSAMPRLNKRKYEHEQTKPQLNDGEFTCAIAGLTVGPKLYYMFYNSAQTLFQKAKAGVQQHQMFHIPLYHNTRGYYLAVFLLIESRFHVLLINRDATTIAMHDFLISRKSRDDVSKDDTWFDDYCKIKHGSTHLWWFRDVDFAQTFDLKPDVDCLSDYDDVRDTLCVRGKHMPSAALHMYNKHVVMYRDRPSWKNGLFLYTSQPKNMKFVFMNLFGKRIQFICIRTNGKNMTLELEPVDIVPRLSHELCIGYDLGDVMTAEQTSEFVSTLWNEVCDFDSSQCSLYPTKIQTMHHKHNDVQQRHQLKSHDGAIYHSWMKYLRSNLPPAVCYQIRTLCMDFLCIPAAWHQFQAHYLTITRQRQLAKPQIMYHGVRGKDPLLSVNSIINNGFNHKYTQRCAYGAGGTYCSPQFSCALQYTTPTNTSSAQFIFVCLVLPGNVKFGGQVNEQMRPDQNAWCAHLPDGHQIYCVEAILPIALLTVCL